MIHPICRANRAKSRRDGTSSLGAHLNCLTALNGYPIGMAMVIWPWNPLMLNFEAGLPSAVMRARRILAVAVLATAT